MDAMQMVSRISCLLEKCRYKAGPVRPACFKMLSIPVSLYPSSAKIFAAISSSSALREADLFRLAGLSGKVVSMLRGHRSEEHTSELQSLMRISYAVFCLKKKKQTLKHIR